MSAVTVLGTGAMGSGLAENLVAAGHQVTVWNRTATAAEQLAVRIGALAAGDLTSAVRDAEFVMSCLTDDVAARAVWVGEGTGALAAVPLDATVIESSTVTPGWARELAGHVAAHGSRFLEAPIVGSLPQLSARQIRYLVAGEIAVLGHSRGVLNASAAAVDHVGVVGDAATLKLAVNALLAVQVAAYGEMLGVLERSKIDRGTALEVLLALPITSPAMQRVVPLLVERNFRPNFPVRLVKKDLDYLRAMSVGVGADVPMADACCDVATFALEAGDADADIGAIARRFLDPARPSTPDPVSH